MSGVTGSTERLLVPIGQTLVELNLWTVAAVAAPVATVFCVHDFDGNGLDFAPLAQRLAELGYHVVLPDMPGRGRSAELPAGSSALPGQVAALRAVLAHHAAGDAVVIASGWGAAVALATLGTGARGLRGFVAADLPLDFSIEGDPLVGYARENLDWLFETKAAACEAILQSPAFAGSGLDPSEVVHRIRRDTEGFRFHYSAGIVTAAEQLRGARFDLAEALSRLSCPVLLLAAQRRGKAETRRLDLLQQRVDDLQSVEFGYEQGHILMQRGSELLVLEQFLKRLSLN